LWKQDKLTAREVTRPVIIGDYVVVGDYAGYLHLMSRFDGQFVGRVQVGEHDFDNPAVDSGILVPPLVYADHLIVITRDGSLYNYQLRPVVAEQDE
jgi:outer membrane protein assembly factor BamB